MQDSDAAEVETAMFDAAGYKGMTVRCEIADTTDAGAADQPFLADAPNQFSAQDLTCVATCARFVTTFDNPDTAAQDFAKKCAPGFKGRHSSSQRERLDQGTNKSAVGLRDLGGRIQRRV